MKRDTPPTDPGPSNAARLTAGRTLARNVAINLAGQLLPVLMALLAVPPLIGALGDSRFGLLSLVWIFIGYFSLFDFGLGRALTQVVAERLGQGREGELPALIWSALLVLFALGLLGALATALLTPWLVGAVLNVPPELRDEALGSFYLLSATTPLVTVTTGLIGVLSAVQRFDLLTLMRLPLAMFTYLGPLLAVQLRAELLLVTAVLAAGRVLVCLLHLACCLWAVPALRRGVVFAPQAVRPLFGFGGWMTVSNIVGPLMLYLDRFLLGAVLAVGTVAYYATPYDLVSRVLIVPLAIVGVLFPAFGTAFAQDRSRAALIYDRGNRLILLLLAPLVVVLVVFAYDGMALWITPEFAERSYRALQWLAVGTLLNGLAQVPFALVQGLGRPDITAKLHLIELPCYALAVWWLLGAFGVVGLAVASTLRMGVDLVALVLIGGRLLPEGRAGALRVLACLGVVVAGCLLVMLVPATPARALAAAASLALALGGAWRLLLTAEERGYALQLLSRLGERYARS